MNVPFDRADFLGVGDEVLPIVRSKLEQISGLRRSVWRNLDIPSRVAVLQEVSDAVTVSHGLASIPVSASKMSFILGGGFTPSKDGAHRIELNSKTVAWGRPALLAKFAVHEAEHAVQENTSANPVTRQQRIWAINNRFYIGGSVLLPLLIFGFALAVLGPWVGAALGIQAALSTAGNVVAGLWGLSNAYYYFQPVEWDARRMARRCRSSIRRAVLSDDRRRTLSEFWQDQFEQFRYLKTGLAVILIGLGSGVVAKRVFSKPLHPTQAFFVDQGVDMYGLQTSDQRLKQLVLENGSSTKARISVRETGLHVDASRQVSVAPHSERKIQVSPGTRCIKTEAYTTYLGLPATVKSGFCID